MRVFRKHPRWSGGILGEPGSWCRLCADRELLLGVYSDPADHIVTFPDDVVHQVDLVWEARIVGGRLQCSRESKELRFDHLCALPADLVPLACPAIDGLVAGRAGVAA
jgi:hypothetical protein